jgi:hypothetical protein
VGVNAGSGTYLCSLPFPADTTKMQASSSAGLASVLGGAVCRDNSVPNGSDGNCYLYFDGVNAWMRTSDAIVTSTAPFTWAASDVPVQINFCYFADENAL